MKTSYGERDYSFGQTMLMLRTTIGLTQAGLAHYLGISRRAIGEWEMGGSYPKVEHLKQLIALGVEQQAFPAGQEAEEIRQLWKSAHQKLWLDERWLSTLLDQQQRPPHLHLMPPQEEQAGGQGPASSPQTPVASPRVDWGDALALSAFYGRQEELAQLIQWVKQEHCQMVSVLGMGGIGKSALVVSAMQQLAEHFEVIIFRSLRNAPSCELFLDECLQVLSPEPLTTLPATLGQRISLFLEYLRTMRALVVLDNLESLLEDGDPRGHFRPDFESYGQVLRRVAETKHQSCLLLTSREKLAELRPFEGKHSHSPVRSLRLTGLDTPACQQLLAEREVVGTTAEQEILVNMYGGNPLAIKIVGETIFDLFAGAIEPFLTGNTVIFGSITSLLSEQFARLSALEQSVLCWLAIMREPLTLDELMVLQVIPLPRIQLLEAVDAGHRRSLIDRGKQPGRFTLQSVMLEYVTTWLITEGCRDIQLHRLDLFIRYGLEQATAREYVRLTQQRLLLSPILDNLQRHFQRQTLASGQEPHTVQPTSVEEHLRSLLDDLRKLNDAAQGYGPANLIALLRILRGNLNGLDLSHLCIRGAYLQGITMQDTSLSGALIRDTVLTEAVKATWAVAIAPSGQWWAAGSQQGKIRVWEEESQTLHRIWQAHSHIVYSLAFSADGRLLASGSLDGTVKLWDVEHGVLLWTGWQKSPYSLAFSPSGNLLASAGADATVRLWETRSDGASLPGAALQTLTHASPVHAVAFSPDGQWLVSGCFDGQMRLWETQKADASTWVEIDRVQTSWITSLIFAPDGRTLASAHQDQTVRFWETADLRLLNTPSQLRAKYLAWSPDGHLLAGSGSDKTIRVYDVEQSRLRSVLHGHTREVYRLAFAPDTSHLLSGSEDGTLRVWNVESGQCMRVISGHGVTFVDLDRSPDDNYLVSGGTDALVTIWDVSGKTSPRVLHDQSWIVSGVGWSPDGKLVASCSWDKTLCLWDASSGVRVQRFESTTVLLCTAWSPDGNLLACGTLGQGMQMWDRRTSRLLWVGQPSHTGFPDVVWSPDGTTLAGAGHDGSVYLWESTSGTLQKQLSGHRGWVVSVGWSPDGLRLASGSDGEGSGELFLWDVKTGERLGSFAGHAGQVCGVAWSPHGDRLISGDSDGILRWWDGGTGACVNTRQTHEGAIRSLKVSHDGRWLASCGDDGVVIIRDLYTGEHLRTLRHDRPYERLNITGIRGLNEAQNASLQALGAFEETLS